MTPNAGTYRTLHNSFNDTNTVLRPGESREGEGRKKDFITLARTAEADSVEVVASQFFKLLGWCVSEGEKDLSFSTKFKALGIEIDLSRKFGGYQNAC